MSELARKLVEGFHKHSFYAGVNTAFIEVVGLGCKGLALSSPYTREEAEALLPYTVEFARRFGVEVVEEPSLLTSLLFPREIAEGKTVFLIAREEALREYQALKRLREESDKQGNPRGLEEEIAWRLGRLLSYDDESIKRLIEENG